MPDSRRRRFAGTPTGLVCGAAVALSLVAGCVTPAPVPPPAPAPQPVAPVSPWPGMLQSAQRLADAGRFAEADRLLASFAVERPNSVEGAEADFWRALFKSDPTNHDVSVREQLAAFDAYLGGGPGMPRYAEAQVLRRLVETADSTRALVIGVRAAYEARERAKNDEVRRLSDELEKALAELERIRRRLVPRPDDKKPPPR